MCSVCWLSFGITNLHEKQVPGVSCLWLKCWFCDSYIVEVFQLFSVNGLLRGLTQIEANQNMISPSWRTSGAELSHRFPPQCVWEGKGAAQSPLSIFSLFYFPPYFLQTQKCWVWFLLSTTKVRQACAFFLPSEPLAAKRVLVMLLQSLPAKEVLQGVPSAAHPESLRFSCWNHPGILA